MLGIRGGPDSYDENSRFKAEQSGQIHRNVKKNTFDFFFLVMLVSIWVVIIYLKPNAMLLCFSEALNQILVYLWIFTLLDQSYAFQCGQVVRNVSLVNSYKDLPNLKALGQL